MNGRAKRGFWTADGRWVQYWAPITDLEDEPEDDPSYTPELILGLDALTAKQRFVIECRYGLRGHEMTVCEIAALMGVSHQAVVRLEQRSIRALRRGLQESPMGAWGPITERAP